MMRWNQAMWRYGAVVTCCAAFAGGCRTAPPATGYETSQDPVVEQSSRGDNAQDREPAPMINEPTDADAERRGTKIDLGLGGGAEDGTTEVHIESSETLLDKQEQAHE